MWTLYCIMYIYWILNTKYWTLGTEHWVLKTVCSIFFVRWTWKQTVAIAKFVVCWQSVYVSPQNSKSKERNSNGMWFCWLWSLQSTDVAIAISNQYLPNWTAFILSFDCAYWAQLNIILNIKESRSVFQQHKPENR